MNDIEALRRNWKIIAKTISIVVVVVIIAQLISLLRNSGIDRKNYTVVAETFIRKSGFIANKLGKIEDVSHIGKGGSGVQGIEALTRRWRAWCTEDTA